MRAFKQQYDCQIEDFIVSEGYVEYKERQTKNRQGDEGSFRKRARKYNIKIWKTDCRNRLTFMRARDMKNTSLCFVTRGRVVVVVKSKPSYN